MAITKTIEIDVNELKAVGGLDNLDKALQKVDKSARSVDKTFEEVYGDLQPLTTRMGEAEDRLYELALAGQSATQEYQDLLQTVANYRKVQIQTDMVVDASATTFDSKLGGALQGVTSAFAGVQGAMALTGNQSEELEQALLKVQGAMALAEGVRGIREGATAFKAMGMSAKIALQGIRTGIAATGIGVLLLALGGIVAYWDDIKTAVNGVSSEQEKLNELAAQNVVSEQSKLDAIGGQENILKLQGKSEKDILKLKIAQTDQVIKATENQIKQNDITAQAQIAAAQRNKDILVGIINFIQTPLRLLLQGVDAVGEALGQEFGLAKGFEKLVDKGVSLIFDPEAEKKKAEETRKESLKALEKLKNDRAGFQLSIKNIDEQANKDALAKQKEYLDKQKEQLEKALAEEKKLFEQQQEVIQKGIEQVKSNDEKRLEALKAFGEKKNEELKKQVEQERERAAAEIEIDRLKFEQKIAQANEASAVLSGLGALLGKQTAAGKALGIASALINTYVGVSEALKQPSTLPSPFDYAAKAVNVAGILAAGFKTVKAITSVKVPGGSGGGGNAPSISASGGGQASAPAPSFNVVGNTGVNQIAQTLGNQQPIQAFVVGSQVTTQQALDRNLVNNATL